MVTALKIFTDGAFAFGWARPGYGWVAFEDGDSPIARGSGAVRNDGSNNVAGEAAAALEALRFAVARGVRSVHLCTDLETLGRHIHGVPTRRSRRVMEELRLFVAAHPDITITVEKVPSSHPRLQIAHHLARAAISVAPF